ncbi:uncharacterized protein PITG_11794 [Phytophthora infestans T30-4]|uniref:Inositol polyphosphate-related phosphatase domain-containing protein n=1 Tax=Phytophthora infestans (strain T30-4) TaxID=403677 RepID=D0NHU5_PHYIT|nr:uncharacterized protein PITG_11794 [Phytophthora infestans T30-4]EEY58820.1 conserved hypothetical protein [Phytophthora infestans T30-4]|eukprot:XP_002901293.1 conserved hypothetical protein [Phytophthora infestans T30-4]
MPSLWGLRLGRYDPTTSKPSKGWCNDVPYDDSDAEAEWEEYIRRQRSLESNQLDNASFKTEDASEEAIDNEIEESTLTSEIVSVDDDFDDEIFALTPETCPSPSGSPRAVLPKVPLRIFVATWNMAAKDPFAHRRRGQYIGDVLAAETLRELLPLGYDIYAIGTQEKVTKHLHAAVLARLNQQPVASLQNTEQMYQRLELTAKRRWLHSRRRREDECQHWRTYQSPNASFCCGDVPSPQSPGDTEDSDAGCSWWNKETGEKEIRGRGDHAFIRRKSTGLAVYYASHLHGQLEVVAAGLHKFTGSKGGVAVTIRVAGDPQTLTFVNCHLEAHKIERRRRQLDKLARALPRSLELNTTLAKCSDHVVWMGDFNYRIQVLEGSEVLHYLTAGRLQELHDHYDSMTEDLKHVPGLKSFREPAKWPTFYPTYKKVASRSRLPLSGSTTGTGRDTRWAQHVYQTTYREPFYKGGRVRERVPGWCDRILYCSRADSPWENCFKVEQVECSDSSLGRSSFGSDTVRDNYRALNDELRGSDHSPVSCTFLWSVQR